MQNIKLLSLLLVFIGFYSPAQAQTVIEDPQHLLDQVDQFINPVLSFDQAFTCGDVATFDHTVDNCEMGCSEDGCYTSCTIEDNKVATHTVSQCTNNQISIFSDDAENMDFMAGEYTALKGNQVRKFMANLSSFMNASGKIVLTTLAPTTFTLVPGMTGSPSYAAVNLSGKFIIEGYQDGPAILFTVLKGAPGVAQLARFRLGTDTWFRLKTIQKKMGTQ